GRPINGIPRRPGRIARLARRRRQAAENERVGLMRVFKTSYRDKKGRTKEAAKWYVEFRDHLEIIRRLPAFASKAASEELGRNLEKLVAFHKASGGQTDPALTRFLAGLAGRTI